MKLFLLFVTLSTCVAAGLNNLVASLLLADRYGKSSRRRDCRYNPDTRRWRCPRRENNDFLPLLLAYALRPGTPSPPPTPPPSPGCFPESATLERQTVTGEFEVVSIANLTYGDKVKCLAAPMGPATENAQVGLCEYSIRGHRLPDSDMVYDQIMYEENGMTKMLSLTPNHVMWSSTDQTLEGVVDSTAVKITNNMFVSAEKIRVGDTIIVKGSDDVLRYRKVTAHTQQLMHGVYSPILTNGGLIFVDGVLATTSPSTKLGGHWGDYFKRLWRPDSKFVDATTNSRTFMSNPWYVAEVNGTITVDNDCFVNAIVADMKNNIDVTDFKDYTPFAKVYIAPCVVGESASV